MNNEFTATPELRESLSRRDLLKRTGLIAGSAFAATALASVPAFAQAAADAPPAQPAMAPGAAGDLEILQYALLLERLEATYYTRTLEAHGRRAYLLPRYVPLATAIRDHEVAHVQALTQAITQMGGTPDPESQFQFPSETFISPIAWNFFAQTLEETGVSAYLGQANRLKSKELLKAAASIYGVEARHAAILKFVGASTASPRVQEHPRPMAEIKRLVAPFVVGGLPGVTPEPAMMNQPMTAQPMMNGAMNQGTPVPAPAQ